MSTTTLIVIGIVILLFGGYFYAPGPWRGGPSPGAGPAWGSGLLGLIVAIIVLVIVLRLLHVIA